MWRDDVDSNTPRNEARVRLRRSRTARRAPARPDVQPAHVEADRGRARELDQEHRDRPPGARRERWVSGAPGAGRGSGARAARLAGCRAAGRRGTFDVRRACIPVRIGVSGRGVVVVDQGLDVRPFAEMLHRIEPMLRGPAFAGAFQPFEDSLGLERIPEPLQSFVRETTLSGKRSSWGTGMC